MYRKYIFIIFLLAVFLGATACGPTFVPDPVKINQRWDKVKRWQNDQQPRLDTKTKSDRLNQIVIKLADAADVRGLRLKLKKDKTWNATMNSLTKELVVHTGLLDTTPSDDEVAAVVAHEIGHYIFDHARVNLNEIQKRQAIVRNAYRQHPYDKEKAEEEAITEIQLRDMLLTKPKSRNMEREADSFGIMLSEKAGYDPAAAISVWLKKYWEAEEKGVKFTLLDTHPMSDERIVNLLRTVAAFRLEGEK